VCLQLTKRRLLTSHCDRRLEGWTGCRPTAAPATRARRMFSCRLSATATPSTLAVCASNASLALLESVPVASAHLSARAAPGVDRRADGQHPRSMRLPGRPHTLVLVGSGRPRHRSRQRVLPGGRSLCQSAMGAVWLRRAAPRSVQVLCEYHQPPFLGRPQMRAQLWAPVPRQRIRRAKQRARCGLVLGNIPTQTARRARAVEVTATVLAGVCRMKE